jgi:hypothetical protein
MTSSYESWLPECNGYPAPIREPEPVQDYAPQPRHLFDGHLSPSASINPAPRQFIEPFDSATQELRIVLHRHPVKPEFLQNTYKEAKKNHGQVRTVAVYVMHGMGDSQSITVLRSLNFTRDHTRNAGQGVVFTRDMRKQEPKPKVEPKPEPEPKELNWSERELQITSDAIKARRAIGVHETFLTGLLREQAEQQKAVDEQNAAGDAVKDTEEWKELCRQERELQKEIDALKRKRWREDETYDDTNK